MLRRACHKYMFTIYTMWSRWKLKKLPDILFGFSHCDPCGSFDRPNVECHSGPPGLFANMMDAQTCLPQVHVHDLYHVVTLEVQKIACHSFRFFTLPSLRVV